MNMLRFMVEPGEPRKGLKRNQKPNVNEVHAGLLFMEFALREWCSPVNKVYGAQTPPLGTKGFLVGAESHVSGPGAGTAMGRKHGLK
jgi:hypothetical protein